MKRHLEGTHVETGGKLLQLKVQIQFNYETKSICTTRSKQEMLRTNF